MRSQSVVDDVGPEERCLEGSAVDGGGAVHDDPVVGAGDTVGFGRSGSGLQLEVGPKVGEVGG